MGFSAEGRTERSERREGAVGGREREAISDD